MVKKPSFNFAGFDPVPVVPSFLNTALSSQSVSYFTLKSVIVSLLAVLLGLVWNTKTSLPPLPVSMSFPAPPQILSLPAPPQILSFPELPLMTSLPARPFMASWPAVPLRTSLPAVPVSFWLLSVVRLDVGVGAGVEDGVELGVGRVMASALLWIVLDEIVELIRPVLAP